MGPSVRRHCDPQGIARRWYGVTSGPGQMCTRTLSVRARLQTFWSGGCCLAHAPGHVSTANAIVTRVARLIMHARRRLHRIRVALEHDRRSASTAAWKGRLRRGRSRFKSGRGCAAQPAIAQVLRRPACLAVVVSQCRSCIRSSPSQRAVGAESAPSPLASSMHSCEARPRSMACAIGFKAASPSMPLFGHSTHSASDRARRAPCVVAPQ